MENNEAPLWLKVLGFLAVLFILCEIGGLLGKISGRLYDIKVEIEKIHGKT